mmetsp:Transcript_32564/g.53141  ORF Transcript_32564/g.53141 Transcript_32564/m.53141 type:complete len:516 (-) Transcript_32564:204-1751(-)
MCAFSNSYKTIPLKWYTEESIKVSSSAFVNCGCMYIYFIYNNFAAISRLAQIEVERPRGEVGGRRRPTGRPIGNLVKSLLEVGLDVLDVLDAHAHADHVRPHVRRQLLRLCQLGVRGGGGVDDQGLGVAHVRQVRGQFHAVHHRLAPLQPALHPKGEHAPVHARAEVLVGLGVRAVGGQAQVAHPRHLGVVLQPVGHLHGVGAGALHAQAERLHALDQAPGAEGVGAHADVAHALHARADGQAHVGAHHAPGPEGLPEVQPVVGRRGLGHERELAVAPVEGARVHQHAAQRGPVAPDPLRGALHHHVRAVVDRPANVPRAREGVVHDQGDPVPLAHRLDLGEVGHAEPRVADGLHVDRLRVGVHHLLELLRAVVLGQPAVDAQPGHGDLPLVVGAPVQVGRRDDVVARLRDGHHRQELRRVPGGGGHGHGAALQGRDAVLEDVRGRIVQPAVDVAELLQGEQVLAMSVIVECVRRGWVDGNSPRVGHRVDRLASMLLLGLKVPIGIHREHPRPSL